MVQLKPKEITVEFDDLLNGLSNLPVPDLERLVDELNAIVSKRRLTFPLTEEAVILVSKIENEAPSADFEERYHDLLVKSVSGTINKKEREELLEMVPVNEMWAVQRLDYLIQLSEIWDTSVDEVMKYLNISPPEDIYG